MFATDYAPTSEFDKPISKARIWIGHPQRRQFKSADFLPGDEDTNVLNLWTGWAVQPAKGKCTAWMELLDVICDGDKQLINWMLHWLANIVREPQRKPLTAPVMIGPEGAGKSLLLGYFGKILGSSYVVVTHDDHVHGKFNQHLSHALLLHSEEALFAGDRKHAGITRSLITDEFRMFERKNIDAHQVRNYLRLVLTANDAHAAPAKPGDRRYTVIDMGSRKLSDALRDRVLKEFYGDGPAALHHFLTTMKYDDKIPRTNVKNQQLLDLKHANMAPIESWWQDTLSSGQILPDCLAWCTQPEKEDWPIVVSSVALFKSMIIKLRELGRGREAVNDTRFGLMLRRFMDVNLVKAQRHYDNPMLDNTPPEARNLGECQNSIINIPPLTDCRAAFERYLGQPIQWPADDDTVRPAPREHEKF